MVQAKMKYFAIAHLFVFFVQGYQREGKCLLALGNAFGAIQSFDKCLVIDPKNSTFQQDVSKTSNLILNTILLIWYFGVA